MPAKKITVKWLKKPQPHDYQAAMSYLSLIYNEPAAKTLVKKLKNNPMTAFKAKDIFRASGLPLLGVSNSHVKKDQVMIQAGQALSPLLLTRETSLGKAVIADGYHRLCAVYSFNEDEVIPCKIA